MIIPLGKQKAHGKHNYYTLYTQHVYKDANLIFAPKVSEIMMKEYERILSLAELEV